KTLPASRGLPRPGWRSVGVAALVLAAAFGVFWYLTGRHTLHVVNGFDSPMVVRIGDVADVAIPPHGHVAVTLGDGKFDYQYTIGTQPEQKGQFTFDTTLAERFQRPKINILNPGAGAVILRDQVLTFG